MSSIFQQWAAQSQLQKNDIGSPQLPFSSSYRVLLQCSYSLGLRITAAEPSENLLLYKRARLATPPERAFRDIQGASETAWLLRLIELSVQYQQRQNAKVPDSNTSETGNSSVIFLRTKTQSKNCILLEELREDFRREVKVIDVCSHDTFGRGGSRNDMDHDKTNGRSNNHKLRELFRILQQELIRASTSKTPAIFIWQSLTPLIAVHGFQNTLRLLCSLRCCLQVWPVNLQVMTPKQHTKLEDASNAILCLSGGEMNMIRQGIRERGNVLRQSLPFRLEPVISDIHNHRRFRLVEETEDEISRNDQHDDHIKSDAGESNRNDMKHSKTISADKSRSTESSNRSRGLYVHLKESEGGRNENKGANFSAESDVRSPSQPRIYLQDDDPEFNDFDEEDPDDDLDI